MGDKNYDEENESTSAVNDVLEFANGHKKNFFKLTANVIVRYVSGKKRSEMYSIMNKHHKIKMLTDDTFHIQSSGYPQISEGYLEGLFNTITDVAETLDDNIKNIDFKKIFKMPTYRFAERSK